MVLQLFYLVCITKCMLEIHLTIAPRWSWFKVKTAYTVYMSLVMLIGFLAVSQCVCNSNLWLIEMTE